MRIVLKSDWDTVSHPPSKDILQQTGHFAGRKKELSTLYNELLRKEQGAILVSGYRGVGKTSFVYKTLQDLFKQYQNKRILAVLLNSTSLDGENGKSNILTNLIRRLYTVSLIEELPNHIQGEIESLYKKSISSEFKYVESSASNKQYAKDTKSSLTLIGGIEKINLTQIVWFFSFLVAIFLQIYPPTSLTYLPNWLNKTLPLLLAFPIPLLFSFLWQYTKTTQNKEESFNSAQRLYTLDNNISNLEFDLDKLHNHLSKEGIKTIYVIDELDKLNVNKVAEILKYFKNLFTLSRAIFIFIGSEELSTMGKPNNKTKWERPLEYTYFTSKYFLSRPTAEELFEFLDEIIEKVEEQKNNQEFEVFKRLATLEAKCDFFNLIQVIKGYVTEYDGVSPVIIFDIKEQSERKAKIQETISLMYNQKYHSHLPSKWEENEVILRALYDIGNEIVSTNPGFELQAPSSDDLRSLNQLATSDFYRYLYSLGVLDLAENEVSYRDRYDERGKQTGKKFIMTDFMPKTVPQELKFTSQLEENLYDCIDRFFNHIVNFWNIDAVFQDTPTISLARIKAEPLAYIHKTKLWGLDIKYLTNEVIRINEKASNNAIFLEKDDVEKYIQIVRKSIETISTEAHITLSNLIQDNLKSKKYVSFPEIKTESNDLNGWQVIKDDLIKTSTPYCFMENDQGHKILICNGKVEPTKNYSYPNYPKYGNTDYEQGVIIINPQKEHQPSWHGIIEIRLTLDAAYSIAEINSFVKKIEDIGVPRY